MDFSVIICSYSIALLSICVASENLIIQPTIASLTCSEDPECPPGLFCVEGHCQCGKKYPHRLVKCDGCNSYVFQYGCITFDESKNLTSVGMCLRPFNSTKSGPFVADTRFEKLPQSPYELNSSLCGSFNRTGKLCGRCLPDHYPLAYSYSLTCIRCGDIRWNWLKYIAAAYIPLTLFYFGIIFFKVSTISSHSFGVVYFCQTISMPFAVRTALSTLNGNASSYTLATNVFIALYGIWNLDFFRAFYTDLCLGMGILPTIALDYAIAVYPLFLIVISYLLIELHDRSYRVVITVWRPFRYLFSRFRRNWNIKTSVIDAFGTFIFLSNFKFLSVSFDLLTPVTIYHLYPDHYNSSLVLYYAGDIDYFGREHLPYAILAILVVCIFVLLPVSLLAIFPFRFFQKFLNLFPVRWYILRTYMDSFYGSYKNGTQPGTRNCRWFVAVFFFARFVQLVIWSTANALASLTESTIVVLIHIALVVLFQPFKSSTNHKVNIFFLLFYSLFLITATGASYAVNSGELFWPTQVFILFGVILACIPVLYIVTISLYWTYKHRKFGLNLFVGLKLLCSHHHTSDGYERLPDRMENSAEYYRVNLSNFLSQQ